MDVATKFESLTDFTVADEHPLQAESAGDFRSETFNQWAYDPVADVGLNIWFASGENGGMQFPHYMSTVIVFVGNEKYTAMRGVGSGNYPDGIAAGNCFLTRIEPFRRWTIDYLGLLDSETTGQTELSRMQLTVEIVSPPIEQGSQGDRGDVASSGTRPRRAIRYEQLCRITGRVEIGARHIDLNAYGMRSHRRNSDSIYDSGAVGHTWATALFPSGQGFHLLAYQVEPRGEVGFLYGHYFDGERYHEAEVTRFPYFSGNEGAEQSRLQMRVGDRVLDVFVESQPPLAGTSASGIRLTRAAARFTLDGEVGGGVLERSLGAAIPSGGGFEA